MPAGQSRAMELLRHLCRLLRRLGRAVLARRMQTELELAHERLQRLTKGEKDERQR